MSKKKGVAKPAKEGLVIDSSIAIAWCFPDEKDAYSQTVLDALASQPGVRTPDLWHLEVANTLVVGERRKRSTHARSRHMARLFSPNCRSYSFPRSPVGMKSWTLCVLCFRLPGDAERRGRHSHGGPWERGWFLALYRVV